MKYNADKQGLNKKNRRYWLKILDTSNLVTPTAFNSKTREGLNKIPG